MAGRITKNDHDGRERPPGTGRQNKGVPPLVWIVIAILLGWLAVVSYSAWT
jgi:hypothetical protein